MNETQRLAIRNRKLTERIRKLKGDLKNAQQMNVNISRGNAYLNVKLSTVTSYFMQSVVVLEDVADRFDIIESNDGFQWAGDLKKDIETILTLESKLEETSE